MVRPLLTAGCTAIDPLTGRCMLLTDKTSRVSAGTLVVLRSNSTATRCESLPTPLCDDALDGEAFGPLMKLFRRFLKGLIRRILPPVPERGGGPALLPAVIHSSRAQITIKAPLDLAGIFLQCCLVAEQAILDRPGCQEPRL